MAAWVIVGYAVRESVRRRVFAVVLVLTLAFLVLYGLGVWRALEEVDQVRVRDVDSDVLTSATLMGLSMFGTLFLGTVLAVFLTLGVVRGDAERGLLQPLVVRPVPRQTLIAARLGAAAVVSAVYVGMVYASTMVITGAQSGWWPDQPVRAGFLLAGAVVVVTAISVLGAVLFTATANGIAVFMVFGAGLVGGLLGQVAEAIDSSTLQQVSDVTTWALPFEALYQAALHAITADASGLTEVVVRLGPFGGASAGGVGLVGWSLVYFAAVVVAAMALFSRRDLT